MRRTYIPDHDGARRPTHTSLPVNSTTNMVDEEAEEAVALFLLESYNTASD
jgi:hypothetical protein